MPEESKLVKKYEKAKKFTEEEIVKIKDIQKQYLSVQQALGGLEVSRIRLEQQLDATLQAKDELRNKFAEIQESEKELIQGLNDKYGEGTLNPDTGEFTPNKTK
tara:strand:+ start:161 stop:472 length:312 start_codon:yes stop_codon:yes gene_type:complete